MVSAVETLLWFRNPFWDLHVLCITSVSPFHTRSTFVLEGRFAKALAHTLTTALAFLVFRQSIFRSFSGACLPLQSLACAAYLSKWVCSVTKSSSLATLIAFFFCRLNCPFFFVMRIALPTFLLASVTVFCERICSNTFASISCTVEAFLV